MVTLLFIVKPAAGWAVVAGSLVSRSAQQYTKACQPNLGRGVARALHASVTATPPLSVLGFVAIALEPLCRQLILSPHIFQQETTRLRAAAARSILHAEQALHSSDVFRVSRSTMHEDVQWLSKFAASFCEASCGALFPMRYSVVKEWHQKHAHLAEEELVRTSTRVASILAHQGLLAGVNATISSRVKSAKSVFDKACLRGKAVDDLLALRVVLEPRDGAPQHSDVNFEESEAGVERCHQVAQCLQDAYMGCVIESTDYVTSPKENGYQSLHICIRPREGQLFEVQVRTRSMHEHAERGRASHSKYKAHCIHSSRNSDPLDSSILVGALLKDC